MEQRRFAGSTGGSRGGARTSTGGARAGGSRTGGFSRTAGGRDGASRSGATLGGARGGSRDGGSRTGGYQGGARSGGSSFGSRPASSSSYARPAQSDGASRGGYSRGGSTGGYQGGARSSGAGYAPRTSSPSSYAPRTDSASARPAYAPRTEGGSRSGSSYAGGASRGYQGNSDRGSRPSYGGGSSRGGFSGGRSGGSRGGSRGGSQRDEKIDPTKFINKAVITEEIEHFVPEHQFSDFKITPELKKAIAVKGYVNPTPIQDRSIPHTLQGVDLVGIANTGTGKTGAFLIPLLNKVMLEPKEAVLIVVPTRELALQIEEELQGFIQGSRIRSVCCFGGANISRQIEALRSHRNFVIGTPGRLKDLLERRKLNLSQFRTVVLDEADRMLDMGFVHDMRTILAQVPKERQTLFFSATMSTEVEKLVSEFLNEPVRISVKTRDTSKNIDQDVIYVPQGGSKYDVLADLLKKPEFSRVLIFGRTKHGVDKLQKQLSQAGIAAESIHGNKNNTKRQQALRMFKMGRVRVLVATDVAARGLDISDVSHVINFDVPSTYNDYVHRIGRTGRGDKKGVALTLIER